MGTMGTMKNMGTWPQVIAAELFNVSTVNGVSGMELEFRLGHLVGDTFHSNVKGDVFKSIGAYVQSLGPDRTIRVNTTEKIHGDTKHITTLFLEDQGETKPPPPLHCIRKTRQYTGNLPVEDSQCVNRGMNSPYTIRCSISKEELVPTPPPPPSSVCLVRNKIRTRYIVGYWAYDLTEVTSNTDEECMHEVELELVDTDILFHTPMDEVAREGVYRMTQLLQHIR